MNQSPPPFDTTTSPHRHRLAVPSDIQARAEVLTHVMRGVGGATAATSLLFVPRTPRPSEGWPLLAWVHGTSTGGAPDRAPSLSPTLDGDLTADGYVTGYVEVFARLIDAGFAVVAPDLEGLGPAADTPHPYYDASSLARSVTGAVTAAYEVEPDLAPAWAVIGHSEGGHGALVVEQYAEEVEAATFLGAVAFAPFTSVTGIVAFHGDAAVRDPDSAFDHVVQQDFNVALMAAGLQAVDASFDPSVVMGQDLLAVLPAVVRLGSVGIVAAIADSVAAAGIAAHRGALPGWDLVPAMQSFLRRNDPALIPGFQPRKPTLILQGDADVSVPEPLTSAFVRDLGVRGGQVDYRRYHDVDHFRIVPEGLPAAVSFLRDRFSAR